MSDRIDWTLKVGGAAGQGLQIIGSILTRVFVRAGLHVFAVHDAESRIRGGHNFMQLRVSDKPVNALSSEVDVLVALDTETIERQETALTPEGLILWDPDTVKDTNVGEHGFPVPLEKLTLDAGGQKIMTNTTAVGAVLGMIHFPIEHIESVLQHELGAKGEAVVQANLQVAKAGYDYVLANCKRCNLHVLPQNRMQHMILTGHEAVAVGAMAAGVRFMAAYPMSPSTSIMEFLIRWSEKQGIVVEQAEDEIAAVNLAIGAAYAGVRSITATSGGGLCLMVEGVGLAGMTETPVVIVDAQRPGPSTGLPTRTEQADLLFLIHSSHGEFPRAVLAPGDADQAFHLAAKAVNLAEKYQIPVFLMTDQYLGDSTWTTLPFDLSKIKIERGELLSGDASADYQRYQITDSGVSPRAIPGAGPALVVADSDEHTTEGHIAESAVVRNEMNSKRMRKMELILSEISPPEFYGDENAEVTLLSWGSTRHIVHEAVDFLNAKQISTANSLHFTELWPFPADVVEALLRKSKKLVCAENNATAQLARLLRMETGIKVDKNILKFDGRPFTPRELAESVRMEVLS